MLEEKFNPKAAAIVNFILFMVLIPCEGYGKTVHYDLVIRNEKVNLSGKKEVDFALTVNGSIPGPTLYFTEGDEAEIAVKNELSKEEVSVHWHGILLPPEEDGVPYVNTPPIYPGKSRVFKFKIRQHGTYWYHSHTRLQEQKGVYGAIVILPKEQDKHSHDRDGYDRDLVAVISDWSDENADQIMRNLRKDGDYYLYKKNSVRSYFGALKAHGLKNHLMNEWSRMGGMDLSDVGYDAFLINGKRTSQLTEAKAGERIRLRIINAAASSYFFVSLGGLPMTVISADGVDIEPIQTKEILMGMAETYDVLISVPESKSYELRARAQDGTGYASGWIGTGEAVVSPNRPAPDLYAPMGDHKLHNHSEHRPSPQPEGMGATHSGVHDHHHDTHDESQHESHQVKETQTLTVDSLKALNPTAWPKGSKVHEVKLVLGGDMERYVWHINGKAIHEDRLLLIKTGEVVRYTFQNETMMHHPMHFHGHFFRVINENGELSPLKHTVDVPPHGSRTIEFFANEPGQWMLHCHNLYHMKTGMARVVRYSDYKLTPEMAHYDKHDPHLHEHIYFYSQLEAASNHAKAHFRLMRTWDELELFVKSANTDGKNFSFGEEWETEGDLVYRRWVSNFLNFFGGASLYDKKEYAILGVGYMLPMLIESAISVNHEGKFRLDLERRFQWTRDFFSEVEFTWRPGWGGDRDTEFEVSLMYGPSWSWAAGLMATEKSLGVGAKLQF